MFKQTLLALLIASASAFAPSFITAPRGVSTQLFGEVEDKILAIVNEQIEIPDDTEVTISSSFTEDLKADSLDAVELIMAIEEEFDIEIPDEEAEKLSTVQACVDYVTKAQE